MSDTIVVVYGDHGESSGLDLDRLSEVGARRGDMPSRVPLIIFGTGLPPVRSSLPVGLIDVAPTVLALLGIPPVKGFLGRALDPTSQRMAVRTDGHVFGDDVAWLRDRCEDRKTGAPAPADRCEPLRAHLAREVSASAAIVRHQLSDDEW